MKKEKLENKDLLDFIQNIVLSCYGVIELENKNLLYLDFPSKKKTLQDCIDIKKRANGSLTIEVFVNLRSGIKVTEVLCEMKKRLFYELGKAGLNVDSVSVYVQNFADRK